MTGRLMLWSVTSEQPDGEVSVVVEAEQPPEALRLALAEFRQQCPLNATIHLICPVENIIRA